MISTALNMEVADCCEQQNAQEQLHASRGICKAWIQIFERLVHMYIFFKHCVFGLVYNKNLIRKTCLSDLVV